MDVSKIPLTPVAAQQSSIPVFKLVGLQFLHCVS